MKRTLTPEQQKASEERKSKFRAMVKQIASMTDQDRQSFAARCPVIMTVEQHTLSPVNTMLIAMQNPAATIVGGFRQWRAHGRIVRKGEHGISIWIPALHKEKDQATGEIVESQPDELRFFGGYVFDISQTDEIEQKQAEVAA